MFRLFLLSCALLCSVASAIAAGGPERLLVHFVTVGDSRHDPEAGDITAQDKIWLQNTRVFARMIREMQAVKPELLIFNGDMINGYTADRHVLDRQYAYWRGMAAHLMESGTYLVPVPGNHETQVKSKDVKGQSVKLAMAGNEDAWRANMGDLIIDQDRWQKLLGGRVEAWSAANRPLVGGADGVRSEQRQLSYSFDFRGLHFVVINTDAVGNDGRAPVAWLKSDLESAAKRGVAGYFIFGHRPAYTYRYKPTAETVGLDLFPDNQKAFWDLVEQYHAVYFCGHEHIFNLMQPRKAEGGKAWQLLVGSGGSPFEARPGESSIPEDRLYAWADVAVYSSGRVHLKIFGFDEFFGETRLIVDRDL